MADKKKPEAPESAETEAAVTPEAPATESPATEAPAEEAPAARVLALPEFKLAPFRWLSVAHLPDFAPAWISAAVYVFTCRAC